MPRFIRSTKFKKILSIAALSFLGFGILMIFASCLLAHHGEGIANRRPSDIARGVGISGSLALVAGAGLGLTNGIQPAVESLLGNGEKPEGGTEEGEKEEKPEKEEKEKEEEKEPIKEEKKEEEPKKEEKEKEEETDEIVEKMVDDLYDSFKENDEALSALSSIVGIEATRQQWTKFFKNTDDVAAMLEKMGKGYADKWKKAVINKAYDGKIELPDESKILKGAGKIMTLLDALKNVVTKVEERGYTGKGEIAGAIYVEAFNKVVSGLITKNPAIAVMDTVAGAIDPNYSVEGLINQAEDKWHDVTKEYFENIFNNDDEISQQLQDSWNLSKDKIISNPNLSPEEKLIRLKKMHHILFR
jgi:hypothetical protein